MMREKLDVIQEGTWLHSLPDLYPDLDPQSTKEWLDFHVKVANTQYTESIPNMTPTK